MCLFLGNIETLLTKPTSEGIDVRQELLTFHANYYSSSIMGLTILGKGLFLSSCLLLAFG